MGAELGASETKSEPNVVPLCDILLVLLIIFMVITPMVKKGANVTLPEARNTAEQPGADQMLTIHIQKDGKIFIGAEEVTEITKLAGLIEEKMEEKKQDEPKILVRADGEVNYGVVVDVIDEIRRAGIENVSLISEVKASEF